jgi:hypothetical protein
MLSSGGLYQEQKPAQAAAKSSAPTDWASALENNETDNEEEEEINEFVKNPRKINHGPNRCSESAMNLLRKIPCCGEKLANWFNDKFNVARVKVD